MTIESSTSNRESSTREALNKDPSRGDSNPQAQKYSGKQGESKRSSSSESSDPSSELRKFIGDIEDLIKEGTSLTGEEFNLAKEKLKTRVEEAKVSVEELGGDIADKARKGVESTNQYVHKQPWQAIGAGAAVGLVVGLLLARRG